MSNSAKTCAVLILTGLLFGPSPSSGQPGTLQNPRGVQGFYLPFDRFTVPIEFFGIRQQFPLVNPTGAYVLLVWNDPAVESDTTVWSGYRVRRTIPGINPTPLAPGTPNGQVVGQFKARDTITQICLSQATYCDTDYNLFGIGGGFFFDGFRGNLQPDGSHLIDVRSQWNSVATGTAQELRAVWGSSATDAHAVGSTGAILHYTGGGWNAVSSPVTSNLNGVFGVSATDAIAVGDNGVALRYDGSQWSLMNWATAPDPNPSDFITPARLHLRAVWAPSPGAYFAVGDSGSVFRYNGAQWDTLNYTATWGTGPRAATHVLRGVWAGSTTNAVAVGDSGLILHYDGALWDTLASGTQSTLRAIWGPPAGSLFAAGDDGTILRYNGGTWSPMASGTRRALRAVWGSSSSDVFAAGGAGEILHYDGNAAGEWATMTSVSPSRIYGLWGTASQNVFATGASGTVLHYDGSNPVVDECGRCRVFLDLGNLSGFRSRYSVTSIDTTSGQYEEFVESPIDNILEILASTPPEENLERVAVVPNPYKRSAEWDLPGRRGIHFIHLPDGARVRIFTASLDLVRELRLDARGNPGGLTGELEWNLRNADGREVETGIYIYQVESAQGRTREGHFVVIK